MISFVVLIIELKKRRFIENETITCNLLNKNSKLLISNSIRNVWFKNKTEI